MEITKSEVIDKMKNHYRERKSNIMHYAYSKDEELAKQERQITNELKEKGYFTPKRQDENFVCMEFSQEFIKEI